MYLVTTAPSPFSSNPILFPSLMHASSRPLSLAKYLDFLETFALRVVSSSSTQYFTASMNTFGASHPFPPPLAPAPVNFLPFHCSDKSSKKILRVTEGNAASILRISLRKQTLTTVVAMGHPATIALVVPTALLYALSTTILLAPAYILTAKRASVHGKPSASAS